MAQAEEDVARFVAVTGSSRDQASFMLEATHGNFEQAVQMYLGTWPYACSCCRSYQHKCRQISPPTTHTKRKRGISLPGACICCPMSRQSPASCAAAPASTSRCKPATTQPGPPSRSSSRRPSSSRSSSAQAPARFTWAAWSAFQAGCIRHPCHGVSGAADLQLGRRAGRQGPPSICHACSTR